MVQFYLDCRVTKSGGALGVITAFFAYYVGLADLLAADNVNLPIGRF
jgi:succinate-acetate transporter protein